MKINVGKCTNGALKIKKGFSGVKKSLSLFYTRDILFRILTLHNLIKKLSFNVLVKRNTKKQIFSVQRVIFKFLGPDSLTHWFTHGYYFYPRNIVVEADHLNVP